MLTAFSLEQFKIFEKLDIPKLSMVTLIGGKNNIGKTSLLEAVFLFFDRLNPQMLIRQYRWRGVNITSFDEHSAWAPIFKNFDFKKTVSLSAVVDGKKEKVSFSYNPNYKQTIVKSPTPQANLSETNIDRETLSTHALDLTYQVENETLENAHLLIEPDGFSLHVDYAKFMARKAAFFASRTFIDPNEDAIRFGQLDIEGKQDVILDVLQIIEPKLTSLSTINVGNISLIHGDIGIGRKIPLAYMGDGLARLLSITLAIATTQNGIILIDEIENGIHYSVMPKVWKGIAEASKKFNCQIICTTHSYECLQAARQGFSGDYKNDFSYIRLAREKSAVVAKIFNYDLLETAINSNMEVR